MDTFAAESCLASGQGAGDLAAHDLRLAGLEAHGVHRHDATVACCGVEHDRGIAMLQR